MDVIYNRLKKVPLSSLPEGTPFVCDKLSEYVFIKSDECGSDYTWQVVALDDGTIEALDNETLVTPLKLKGGDIEFVQDFELLVKLQET
ncbi:hypothetical protein [Vibrio phage RYC]|nr:hypothetical protein [Vibrio phage RYC]